LAGGATEQLAVVRGAVSRWQVAHRRAVMVAEHRRRCPQEHGWVAQRAAAGRSGPGGADAGRAFVTLSVSSAGVRRPVSGASGQCPRVPIHATAVRVRCGRLSVQVSGVRCPAWASGVRAFPRPLCPTGVWSGEWRWGRQPHGWDGRGRRGRPPCPRLARRLPGSAPGGRDGRRPCWVQRRRRLGLGRRRGRWLAVARSTAWPTRDRPDAREDRPLVGEPGA
jgi:hypothetical protein